MAETNAERDEYLRGLGKWIILFHAFSIASIIFCVGIETYELVTTGKPPRGKSLLQMGDIYRVLTCGVPILGTSLSGLLIRGYFVNALWLVANVIVIRGVLAMQKYKSYRFAWWTAILVTIPCIGPCFGGAGLIVGPAIMLHLMNAEVRHQFKEEDPMSQRSQQYTTWFGEVRMAAAKALLEMDEPVDRLMPSLLAELSKEENGQKDAISILRTVGPAANEALPELQRLATTTQNRSLRKYAELAIEEITSTPAD